MAYFTIEIGRSNLNLIIKALLLEAFRLPRVDLTIAITGSGTFSPNKGTGYQSGPPTLLNSR
jgi:hypothetical protein